MGARVFLVATSWSFAGLAFLSLYLSCKIKAFDHQGHVAKLCIVILPLLIASLDGISRIDDYRHHWEDVFVGGLIGFLLHIMIKVGGHMHTSKCWRNSKRPIQTMQKTNNLHVGITLDYPGSSITGRRETIWNLEACNLPPALN
ncbi:uncharacterized protein LOC133896170 [Phragmites australis]|uniref:uncharacterized protein LOC133896170 n=1 Tax=Phragmites australis TaxID=29695 RepID=UPI002D7A03D7|nr:uncharacterized protein LOC133896170 [Phragmites australis]